MTPMDALMYVEANPGQWAIAKVGYKHVMIIKTKDDRFGEHFLITGLDKHDYRPKTFADAAKLIARFMADDSP